MNEPDASWDEAILGPWNEALSVVLSSTQDAVTIVRMEDGAFVYVNDTFSERSGLAREEVIGHPYQEFDFYADEGSAAEIAELLASTGQFEGFVAPFNGRNGVMWSEVSGRILQIDDVPFVITVAHDLTRQRAVEQEYRALVEQVPVITYREVVPEGPYTFSTMLYISPQVDKMLGFNLAAFDGDADAFWEQAIHPDDRDRVFEESSRAVSEGAAYQDEYRLVAPDGTVHWVHDESVLVGTDEQGAQVWHGVMIDVTERRAAEDALRAAEQRNRNLIENIPAVVYIDREDPDAGAGWHLQYVSPQIEELLGFPTGDWIESDLWMQRLHPEDRDEALAYDRTAVRLGAPYSSEYRLIARDGREVWIQEEASVLSESDGVRYWQGIMTDITERKRSEEDLRRRETVMRMVSDTAEGFLHASTWTTPMEEMLEMLGRTVGVSRTYLFRNGTLPDGTPMSTQTDEWVAAGVEAQMGGPFVHDIPFEPRDGWATTMAAGGVVAGPTADMPSEDRPGLEAQGILSVLAVPVFVDDQWWGFIGADDCDTPRVWQPVEIEAFRTTAGILGTAVRRQLAEEQLREAEERFRLLVERTPAVVYVDAIDDVSTALYISPAVEDLLGYTADERMASPELWMHRLHPEDRDAVVAESERTNRTGEPFSMDYRMLHMEGHTVWVRDEAVLVRDREGKPLFWQGVLIDITDRKIAEQELERALTIEREATVRLRDLDEMKNTFLTAVSHDLRTPLAAVLGLALTLEREDMGLDAAESRDLAHRIAKNARKLDAMVMDLLDLDRLTRGVLEPKFSRTDVGMVARKVLDEAEFLGDHPVTVEADPVLATVDIGKVERIIENLLVNAARHTPKGTQIWVRVRETDEGALIVVEDAGPGVSAELRDAIFEPFRQGEGASLQSSPGVGIGLSLVARFTELHGGRAWIEEREGGGASFHVVLPVSPP